MKEIPLTQEKFAIVDDCDFNYLNQFKWYANKSRNGRTWYAARNVRQNGQKKNIHMHRLILNPPIGLYVDHINGDGLCNLRSNLRLCTNSQNQQNRHRTRGMSQFKGVSICNGYILAFIWVNGKNKNLGSFKTEYSAANAYNEAALKHFGEFANLNKISRSYS